MKNINFNCIESTSYQERIRSSLPDLIILGIVAALAMYLAWWLGLVVAVLILPGYYLLTVIGQNKFFITHFELKDDKVLIRFSEKGEPKLIAGYIDEFMAVKKAYLTRKKPTPYLVIYHNKKPLIKQYQIGSWNEVLFDEVVLSLGGNVTSGYLLGL